MDATNDNWTNLHSIDERRDLRSSQMQTRRKRIWNRKWLGWINHVWIVAELHNPENHWRIYGSIVRFGFHFMRGSEWFANFMAHWHETSTAKWIFWLMQAAARAKLSTKCIYDSPNDSAKCLLWIHKYFCFVLEWQSTHVPSSGCLAACQWYRSQNRQFIASS